MNSSINISSECVGSNRERSINQRQDEADKKKLISKVAHFAFENCDAVWFASTSHQRICVKCKSYGIAPNTHTDISSHQFPCIACEGFDSIGSAAALELSLGGCASAFTKNCTHVREIKLQIHWLQVVRDCNSHIRIDDIRFSRTAHPPPHTIQSNHFQKFRMTPPRDTINSHLE